MDRTLFLPFFTWLTELSLSKSIADSRYAFAIIEVFHLFGIILLLGGASLMALRMVGLGLREQKISEVRRHVGWYTFAGLVLMLASGLLMLMSNPMKYYNSNLFWYKMWFFWAGFIFHFTLYRKATRSDNTGYLLGGLTALLAIVLWYGTGAIGRAIGFF